MTTQVAPTDNRREAAAAALFALVQQESGRVVKLLTSSRRVRHYESVNADQMPALFQCQRPESYERTAGGTVGIPPKRTMHFELWLYTSDPQEDSIIPVQQLNAMVSAIETALAPSPMTGTQNLGGVVHEARIDGSVEYYENVTSDGKSIAVIPVAVLLP